LNQLSTLTVSNSIIRGNSSPYGGGGIFNNQGILIVNNSTMSGNSTSSRGGGIYNTARSTLIVNNSTISGNSAAIGGGIFNNGGTLKLHSSVVSNNSKDNCTGSGTLVDGGFNLEYPGSTCGFSTHAQSGDPVLGNLADNGGSTQTMALGAGSAAIGNGNCTDTAYIVVTTDQRGLPRHTPCDIGAYELQNRPPPSPTGTSTPMPTTTFTPVPTFTVSVTPRPSPTTTPKPTQPVPPTATPFRLDTAFAGNKPEPWPTGAQIDNGTVARRSGHYVLHAPDSYFTFSTPQHAPSMADGQISAVVQAQGAGEVGVMARQGGTGNAWSLYTCWITNTRQYGCTTWRRGTPQALAPARLDTRIMPNRNNILLLRIVGGRLAFTVNGQIVYQGVDQHTLPLGAWGVFVASRFGQGPVEGQYSRITISSVYFTE
jgi:hypothetical protein